MQFIFWYSLIFFSGLVLIPVLCFSGACIKLLNPFRTGLTMSVTGTPGAVAGQPSVVIPADEFRSLLRTMEQICANQARATDRLPGHLTPEVSVQPYSGVDKQQTVFEFLGSLKDLKNSKEIPDAVFLEKWVPVYLKGVARSWFDHHFVGVVWGDFDGLFY